MRKIKIISDNQMIDGVFLICSSFAGGRPRTLGGILGGRGAKRNREWHFEKREEREA